MPTRKGLLAPQNTFLHTIADRFDGTHSNFVLGNAKIARIFPIVYCSDGFCDLTGYSRAQIMQQSCACNFLYGQKTDEKNRQAIRRALEEKQELKLEVILYRSSGTAFWCLLDIVPIQDEKHEVVLFLCSHKDITRQKWHHQQQQIAKQLANQPALPAAPSEEVLSPSSVVLVGGHDEVLQEAEPSVQERTEPADTQDSSQQLINMDEFGLSDEPGNENDFEPDDNDEHHDKHTTAQYSRRRSRAVLYQLSGHFNDRRSVNMKTKLKLNNRMNLPEYKTTTIEKQRFIVYHYGVAKSCWDWLILMVSFYVAIVIPYNAAFKDNRQNQSPVVANIVDGPECKIDFIDILVEVVFVIDVLLNFRTTFVNRKGEVVTQPKTICEHYIRGWFLVDACAALPFDLLCNLNLYSRSRLDLNLLKLIRLLRLARLLQKMDRYSQYSYIILTLLMLIFSLLAHWCACIWYVIAMEEIDRNPHWRISWLHQLSDKLGYSVVNTTDMASAYVTALYFTTSSLTSVGFGNVSANTNAEKIFSIVIMLIGALMHAVVFGNVTALIRVMYARRSNYQTRLRDLKDFFRLHQLPKELQQRMSDYFQTTWSLNHGIETYEILKDFPDELRGDVSLHLHREVLSLPIFETAPQGFLKSLARHIESKFCCPTEYLIHRGDALSYLYLVCNGSMEILQDNMVVAILGKGDLVGHDVGVARAAGGAGGAAGQQAGVPSGQSHLFGSGGLVKSSSDLKALTYCDLKCIHIPGLLEVLKLYPEFSDTFHQEISHDLTFNLRESHHEEVAQGNEPPGAFNAFKSVAQLESTGCVLRRRDFGGQIGRYDHDELESAPEAIAGRVDGQPNGQPDDDDDDDDDEDEEEEEEEDEDDEEDDEEVDEPPDDEEPDDGGDMGGHRGPPRPPRPSGSAGGTGRPAPRANPQRPPDERPKDLQERRKGCLVNGAPRAAGHQRAPLENWRFRSCDALDGRRAGDTPARPTTGRARPPLSFDLSRNTTVAISSRRPGPSRRGSLGSISAGRAVVGARGEAATASLVHISEAGRQADKSRAGVPEVKPKRRELNKIERRIGHISASVDELKGELRGELNQVRNLLASLSMQLVQANKATAASAGPETDRTRERSADHLMDPADFFHSSSGRQPVGSVQRNEATLEPAERDAGRLARCAGRQADSEVSISAAEVVPTDSGRRAPNVHQLSVAQHHQHQQQDHNNQQLRSASQCSRAKPDSSPQSPPQLLAGSSSPLSLANTPNSDSNADSGHSTLSVSSAPTNQRQVLVALQTAGQAASSLSEPQSRQLARAKPTGGTLV